ncbi:hypothetical protein J5837_07560 [Pseudoxanthomonas helianthi]|uniref:Uncharacterized protein n=1 Tax=Pseudoxanthomonas helianthi TaxID=1453541 RepID=A0A940X4K3_9GAMM|nr:hypothetical protein [Pseudoxanthomonas helianthi]MBP3984283.1 hypothetical protein [Pseudoxanthomonas helianthi]
MSKGGLHAYAFEIVRNPTEAFSTLLAFDPDGASLSNDTLDDILMAIHRKEGLPEDSTIEEKFGIRVRRVRHPSSAQRDQQTLRSAIRQFFEDLTARSAAGLP